jgi:hypothetical protein
MISRIPQYLLNSASQRTLLDKLIQINKVIEQSEKSLYARRKGRYFNASNLLQTDAPRRGVYLKTNIFHLGEYLYKVSLPRGSFTDLGSGLGGVCSVANNLGFYPIVGYEDDLDIFFRAINIREKKLGKEYKGIQFINSDFMKAEISSFDVIYFFRPFYKNFERLMGEKLRESKPGALIISRTRDFQDQELIFPSSIFRRREDKEIPQLTFTVFEKKE